MGIIKRSAENGDEIASVTVTKEYRVDQGGFVAFIRGLFVREENRRNNTATDLLREAIETSGAETQQVEVFASNSAAMKLYNRAGFKVVESTELKNGDKLLIMQRRD